MDVRVAVARWSLGRLAGEDLPDVASSLLLAGHDGPALREETIDVLLRAGAAREAKDANGDTSLAWASWYARPDAILRQLCYGPFAIHPDRLPMRRALLGRPHGRC